MIIGREACLDLFVMDAQWRVLFDQGAGGDAGGDPDDAADGCGRDQDDDVGSHAALTTSTISQAPAEQASSWVPVVVSIVS